jgi:hypothetical protein
MTAARQTEALPLLIIAALADLLSALPAFSPSHAAATERIVVDWDTGHAIGGCDPVAFYSDGKPVAGDADLEFAYGGGSGASETSAIAPPSRLGQTSTCRALAVTIRSASPTALRSREIRASG